MKSDLLMFLVGFLAFSHMAEAQTATRQATSTCQIGTAYSINPNRQLTAEEKVVMVPGGIVTITQRQAPGSSRIVFRRCILPPNEVVVGGLLPWVKKCGQDFVPEGWIVPGMKPAAGPQGLQGPRGLQGLQGPPGPQGPSGLDASPVFVEERSNFGCGKKCKWTLAAIGGAAAGYATWYFWPCPSGTVRRW